MTRRIAIKTKTGITFYDLNSNDRPLTIVGQRLYRTDEKYMLASCTDAEEFCLYDLDSTYPYCIEPPAPDETMAYIDVVKASGKKAGKTNNWRKWLTQRNIVYLLLGCVVIYYIYITYLT